MRLTELPAHLRTTAKTVMPRTKDQNLTMFERTASPALTMKYINPEWSIPPHIRAMDRGLVKIAQASSKKKNKGCKRLAIMMPPGHAKSTVSSVYFPFWYLGTWPDRQVIQCSVSDDLATEFGGKSRDLMWEYGAELFGTTVRSDSKAKHLWKLPEGGSLRAAGVGSSIMGRRCDLLLVDDYFKDAEEAQSEAMRNKVHEWFMTTSQTRLFSWGAIVVVCTRWSKDDLLGRLLKAQPDKWEVLRFPALCDEPDGDELGRQFGDPLWPAMFPKEHLEEVKEGYVNSGYDWVWQALYQQVPPAHMDSEFCSDYFSPLDDYRQDPPLETHRWRVMALDPSLGNNEKSDYSAWGLGILDFEGKMWIEADLRRRDAVQIINDGIEHVKRFKPHAIFVESITFQKVLMDQFDKALREAGFVIPVFGINRHEKEKLLRIRAVLTPHLAQHSFRWKRNPGTQLMLEQLRGFPGARYKDGPDMLSMLVQGIQHVCDYGVDDSNRDNVPEYDIDTGIPSMGGLILDKV